MNEFKMPSTVDAMLVGHVTRNRERGSGYATVRIVWGKKKGPSVTDPFWKLKDKGTATYHIMSTLQIGDDRWLVAMFIPNSYLNLSNYLVAEYHKGELVTYYPAPELQGTFIVKSKSTKERIVADFSEDNTTGRLRCDWMVLRPADYPRADFEVFDKRGR